MNKFEYVNILTKKEIKSYIEKISTANIQANENLQINKIILFNAYSDYENQIINEYKEKLKDILEYKNLWDTKTCVCGKSMRFIMDYNFWGCPDFKNKSNNHITFKSNEDETIDYRLKKVKVRLNHNWCSDILKITDLKSKIKAKELVNFYESEGLEDLRSKYGYKATVESISSFKIANEQSKIEELKTKKFLESFFDKINYQIYVRFKTKNDNEKIRIIDLIVSDYALVYLIEIKRHNIYIDQDQLNLYFDLIKYLMNKKKDKRILKSLFIVHDFFESKYNYNNCVLFENIQNLNTKSEILSIFNQNIFRIQ
jgi:hypothetical protein